MPIAALLMLLGATTGPPPERATPPVFVTVNYGLTFRAPPGSYYCPLQPDWVGSDHGTVIFLDRPKMCDGAGGVSNYRGFLPVNVPRIEVFYAYALDPEDRLPPPKCVSAGRVVLFGAPRKLCVERHHGVSTYHVEADYRFDSTGTLEVTLVTDDRRRRGDLTMLRRFLSSVAACHSKTWHRERRRDGNFLANCPEGDWY
ncbi:MAG: hypothetical protein JWL96_2986 [Sphingomonas bacterium]|nr:hypothetical protein [Sphingomonas bacterium]